MSKMNFNVNHPQYSIICSIPLLCLVILTIALPTLGKSLNATCGIKGCERPECDVKGFCKVWIYPTNSTYLLYIRSCKF